MLPESTQLWAGGAGIARIRRQIEGVQLVTNLGQIVDLIKQWRARNASH
jgi:hypothetical protein